MSLVISLLLPDFAIIIFLSFAMSRVGKPYLRYTAILLLSAGRYTNADLWSVDIDNGPAPSPEDGPPFSAHATRDKALLPYQIIGVLAAYLGMVLILSTALLTFGRKLRKQALTAAERPTEMVKPMIMLLAGQSPARTRLGPFSRLQRKTSQTSSMRSKLSGVASPMDSSVNFDLNVIEEDRQRNQDALAKVYQSIYEAEDRKTHINVDTADQRTVPALSIPRPPRRAPAHLRVDSGAFSRADAQPASPRTPISPAIRAIYPPMPGLPNYEQSQSPIRTRRTGGSMDRRSAQSGEYEGSAQYNLRGKLARDRLRKSLKISAPMRDDNSDGARTPLSPRFYTDPGIPPEPPSAHTVDSQWQRSPDTMRSYREGNEYEFDRMKSARDLPLEHPQRQMKVDGLPLSPKRSMRPLGSPQSRRAANGSGALPLRQFADQQRATPVSPVSTWSAHPISPGLTSPAIRHNEVELDVKRLRGGLPSAMAHMGQTPYSASFMNAMITPVTPHFTTRAERLQKQKEERALRGAITEEDQVQDESEMWRDVY